MYETINLERNLKDFTKSAEFSEYTNVELVVDDNTSVFARSVGNVLSEPSGWLRGKRGDQSLDYENGMFIMYTPSASEYHLVIQSNPSAVRYVDLHGRTLDLSFWTYFSDPSEDTQIVVNLVLKRNNNSDFSDVLCAKDLGVYKTSQSVQDRIYLSGNLQEDGFYGGSGNFDGAYVAIRFMVKTDRAQHIDIGEIKLESERDDPQKVLVSKCLWATTDIARQVLIEVAGYHYRPYEAVGARLDPAATYGDNLVIDGTGSYSVCSIDSTFGHEFVSNVSAPYEEEIDHEYPYTPATDRRFTREIRTLKAELNIQADNIEAKVSSVSGTESYFGWKLLKDSFTIYASGSEIIKATKDGLTVRGRVEATSGVIGGCEIVEGTLRINNANISNITADKITVGIIDSGRIPVLDSSHLGQNSVGEYQITGGAVTNPKLYGGSVSLSKFDGDLNGKYWQIGQNQSDIKAINKKFVTALSVVGLEVTGGGIIIKYQNRNLTFSPKAKNDSAMRYVLGAT